MNDGWGQLISTVFETMNSNKSIEEKKTKTKIKCKLQFVAVIKSNISMPHHTQLHFYIYKTRYFFIQSKRERERGGKKNQRAKVKCRQK